MSGQRRPQEQAPYNYNTIGNPVENTNLAIPSAPLILGQGGRAPTHHLDGNQLSVPANYSTTLEPFLPQIDHGQPGAQNVPAIFSLPTVTSYSPYATLNGYRMRIQIRLSHAIDQPPTVHICILYGKLRRPADVKRDYIDGQFYYYSVESEIPGSDLVQTADISQVRLSLRFQDHYGNHLGALDVGDFSYLDMKAHPSNAYTTLTNRKRKQSMDPADPPRSPTKRNAVISFSDRTRDPYASLRHQSPPQSSPYLLMNQNAPYAFQQQVPYQAGPSPAAFGQHQSRQPAAQYTSTQRPPQPTMASPMPGSSRRSSSVSGAMGPLTMTIGYPSSTTTSAPTLVRTSGLTQSTGTMAGDGDSTPVFNPYAMYPKSRAELKLEGNLDDLVKDWSQSEWDMKRRLVQFQRSQSGSIITATFKPVSIEDRTPGSICVSCILWESRNECFVTSVDTIYLLESLVAVKFTVEEKNRIRRNLEGFRPLTVSKAKADSEEFFKVIMGFPNPKPRNIEKDVKVFPWKILSLALKKIIGKYSASPASTAAPLHAGSSLGNARRVSHVSHEHLEKNDRRALESPISASSSGTSAFPDASLPTNIARSQSWATRPLRNDSLDIGAASNYESSRPTRHSDYLGLEDFPDMTTAIATDWTAHQHLQQFHSVGALPQVLDPSAPRSVRALPQYYQVFPQTGSMVGQSRVTRPPQETYDLTEDHASMAPGGTQNLTGI